MKPYWSKSEVIDAIKNDLAGEKSIKDKITAIKRMIDASKCTALIMRVAPKLERRLLRFRN